ncbi:SPB1 [Enterospora canceri]|uniref:SPB1 n=1 Tax=Enterospora canceri TaxID=1081671 RepID=A0A1Y1S871_9MICR|nr:SPB1 [Enterospora canceri]
MAGNKKQRIDKYYLMAKERGYRARSAFKLLEINKKYGFLGDCRVAVDLCAAPGGWLQILMQEMPPTRKIIGVDLDPIERIGDCETFRADITTAECRRELICRLDGHKADVFVHDGAPNFGTSRERDVFVQNDLVLAALRLATEFLADGGTFVTKIHRSENFTKITNLLGELFGRVNVTKPMSSRDESAEIFAVCREFKNPEEIDVRNFDSNHLFAEIEEDTNIYKSTLLSDWIVGNNPIQLFQNTGSFLVDFESALFDDEFRANCRDLKLVGPKEMRQMIRVRQKVIRMTKSGKLECDGLVASKFEIRFSRKDKKDELSDGDEDVLVKLEEEIERQNKKKERKSGFYDDRVFKMDEVALRRKNEFAEMDSCESGPGEDEAIINDESSCSTDYSLNESELECLAMLKENPEQFKESTVDRHLIDSDDVCLPGEERGARRGVVRQRISRKELEAMGRKKRRALRRSSKKMNEIEIEDEQEEATLYKKILRGEFRKQRKKRRLVFANQKGGHSKIPRGQGHVLRLDRRMKHDMYLAKRKKQHKKA